MVIFMQIETIEVGDLNTNCYLLNINNEVVIIDPGDEFDKIKKAVNNRKVVGVLITHFHFDHIGALEEIIGYYNVDTNKVNSSNFKFEIIETPGHTEDSKTYYFKQDKIMFVGDFIFKNGIGRCDLKGGNSKAMSESIDKIKKYNSCIIYPGHGDKTKLEDEKKNNPFFN